MALINFIITNIKEHPFTSGSFTVTNFTGGNTFSLEGQSTSSSSDIVANMGTVSLQKAP